MPRGPKGEKRPADVIGNAVHVMRIATGQIERRENNAGAHLVMGWDCTASWHMAAS
jgi:hypothetical protein